MAAGCDAGVAGTCSPAVVVEAASSVDVDAKAVELGFVVPGVAGADAGALPDGEETGAGVTGDDVGVVDPWIGSIGDAIGVGGPVGVAEMGCCGEAPVAAEGDG